MSANRFVHLNVHSEYAIIDSTIRIPQLVKTVSKMNMPAVALTDSTNLFAALKFYNAAKKQGIKPLFGSDVIVRDEQLDRDSYELTLLCQNKTGYLNLSRIISHAQRNHDEHGMIFVEKTFLAEWSIDYK